MSRSTADGLSAASSSRSPGLQGGRLNGRFTLLPAVEFRGPHGRRVGPPGEQLNLDAHVDVNPERDSESGPLILPETGVRYQLDFLRVGVREQ